MNQQDNLANQKPIKVQCKCGWVGMSDELVQRDLATKKIVCPKCHADFLSYPRS